MVVCLEPKKHPKRPSDSLLRELRAAILVLGLNCRAVSLAPPTPFSPLPTMCWDCRHASQHLASTLLSLWTWGTFQPMLKGG